MSTIQFWTILGVMVGLFAIVFTLLLRLEARISSVDTKIDSVETNLRQEIRDQTARIDKQTVRIDQVVKDVGELKGYMMVVSERLNIPKSA